MSSSLRSVIAREEKEREMSRERRQRKREAFERRKTHERRERDRRREGKMKSEGATTFKTLPCVPSKRRVLRDTGVLKVHTEAFFSARQEETHTATQHTTTHNTQCIEKREER